MTFTSRLRLITSALLAPAFMLMASPLVAAESKATTQVAAANVPASKTDTSKVDTKSNSKPASKSKITSLSASVREGAAKIDALVTANYGDQKPARPTNDEEFLRRVYLDINGAIPTYEQAKAFLDSKDPMRRQKLIDQLLDSPGYVSHMYNYWADLLRIQDRTKGDYAGHFPQWIKQSLTQNMPFDLLVYEMITAEGKTKDNGAAGFWLRDSGMVLEITATTAQVFLGTQIGCAQCHDHPFDNWEMKQFYELAAFTSEVTTRDGGYRSKELLEVRNRINKGEVPREVGQILQNVMREASYGVKDISKKTLKLPSDYKYDNGKPGQAVSAHVIFGDAPSAAADLTSRERYARWLISPSNPMFSQVIANRLWAKVMGIGIVNPVDDFSDLNKPTNPALLAHLSKKMQELRFDMKEYLRLVLNTKTYQLASNREDYTKDNFKNQAGVLRRMTAEQIWDSFITMVVEDPNAHVGEGYPSAMGGGMMMMAGATDVDFTKMTADQIITYGEKLVAQRRDGRKDLLKNSREQKSNPNMMRASETRQPAPAGHFLREFGSSARETVADAHTDPSVPQVLYLLNGPGFSQVIDRRSELAKEVASAKDDKAKVEVLYLSILSRYPSPTEMAIAMRELKNSGTKGTENLAWALLNTREFIFIR